MTSRTPPAFARLATLALLLLPMPAGAQDRPEPGLTLADAVASALRHNPGILVARLDLDGARAELLGARGAYDARIRTSAGDARRELRVFDGAGGVAEDALSSRTLTYDVGLVKETGVGLVLQPALSMTRTDDPLSAVIPFAQAGASLGVTLPLGYNRGGELTRATERVAEIRVDAVGHGIRQVTALNVRDLVGAYWEYHAARERLEVYRSSEARASRLLLETRTLVAAEERPAADLIQLEANLASKRISRLGAEQAQVAVRQRLGLLMGRSAEEAERLPAATDRFPAPSEFRAGEAEVERLVALATGRRAEVAESELRFGAARLESEAAAAAGRPTLDLFVRLGYTGLTTTADLGGMFSPLFRDIPGLNVTLELSYEASIANRRARGRTAQSAAALDQRRISSESVREQVASGVRLAASALERSVAVLAEAEVAVRLFEQAVSNEKTKYALGSATLFDVILAEDNLTSAMLGAVDGQLRHADALARLHYETGILVESDGSEPRFSAATATTRP